MAKPRLPLKKQQVCWLGAVGLGILVFFFVGFAAADGSAAAEIAPKFLSPSEQAKDIVAFRTGFMDLDRAFTPNARAAAERKLSELERANKNE